MAFGRHRAPATGSTAEELYDQAIKHQDRAIRTGNELDQQMAEMAWQDFTKVDKGSRYVGRHRKDK